MATSGTGSSGDLASDILVSLSKRDTLSSADFPNASFSELKAALDRLSSRCMVLYSQLDQEIPVLEAEGELIAQHGSHEARVFEVVRRAMEGLSIAELEYVFWSLRSTFTSHLLR
jgi:phenylalanyl-tRNA synthetase alpha chain